MQTKPSTLEWMLRESVGKKNKAEHIQQIAIIDGIENTSTSVESTPCSMESTPTFVEGTSYSTENGPAFHNISDFTSPTDTNDSTPPAGTPSSAGGAFPPALVRCHPNRLAVIKAELTIRTDKPLHDPSLEIPNKPPNGPTILPCQHGSPTCSDPLSVDSGSVAGTTCMEQRRARVSCHATRDISLSFSKVDALLYFPRPLKLLSQLYKIIQTVFNFNQKRGLSLILIKYKSSIERLFRHRLEDACLEQLYYIAEDAMEFIPIEAVDNGEKCSTFNIKIKYDVDIDQILYSFLISDYEKWCKTNDRKHSGRTLHPEYPVDSVSVPRKPLPGSCCSAVVSTDTKSDSNTSEASVSTSKAVDSGIARKNTSPGDIQGNQPTDDEPEYRKRARMASMDIYARIRAKEEARREAFISQEKTKTEATANKLEGIFRVSGRRAIKMTDLMFQLNNSPTAREEVLSVCGEGYSLQVIGGTEYLVKK